jgi:CBS-domain-containing membrane protein
MNVLLAIVAAALVGGPGLVRESVVGPGTLGSPADDPSVGYSSVQLDQKLNSPDYDFTRKEVQALLRREKAAARARAQTERASRMSAQGLSPEKHTRAN